MIRSGDIKFKVETGKVYKNTGTCRGKTHWMPLTKISNKNSKNKRELARKTETYQTYILYENDTYAVKHDTNVNEPNNENAYTSQDFEEYSNIIGNDMDNFVDAINYIASERGQVSALHRALEFLKVHVSQDPQRYINIRGLKNNALGVYLYCKFLMLDPNEREHVLEINKRIKKLYDAYAELNESDTQDKVYESCAERLLQLYHLAEDSKANYFMDFRDIMGTYQPLDMNKYDNIKLDTEQYLNKEFFFNFINCVRIYFRILFAYRLIHVIPQLTQKINKPNQPNATLNVKRFTNRQSEQAFLMAFMSFTHNYMDLNYVLQHNTPSGLENAVYYYNSNRAFYSVQEQKRTYSDSKKLRSSEMVLKHIIYSKLQQDHLIETTVFESFPKILIGFFDKKFNYNVETDDLRIRHDMFMYQHYCNTIQKIYKMYDKSRIHLALKQVASVRRKLIETHNDSDLAKYLDHVLKLHYATV